MSDTTIQYSQESPPKRQRQYWPLVISTVAALIAIAAIIFGLSQESNTSNARTENSALIQQNNSLSHEISKIQSQESTISAQLATVEATAKNAQSAATNANQARLGVCWSVNYQSNNGITWVQSLSVDQAINTNGVYTCPQGDTFVSVVPANQGSNG